MPRTCRHQAQLSTRRGLRRLRRAVPAEPAEPSAFKLGGGLGPAEEEAVEQVARPLIGIRRSSQPVQYASWDEGRSQVAAYLARNRDSSTKDQAGSKMGAAWIQKSTPMLQEQPRQQPTNWSEAKALRRSGAEPLAKRRKASPPPPLPQLPTMLPAIRGAASETASSQKDLRPDSFAERRARLLGAPLVVPTLARPIASGAMSRDWSLPQLPRHLV
ncbi:unnamed protein product [Effrenium voratum]|nr:unnamed protein product [Effrenium voratum]CAJ1413814.1 unnamed protein product [Effrenium voratum]